MCITTMSFFDINGNQIYISNKSNTFNANIIYRKPDLPKSSKSFINIIIQLILLISIFSVFLVISKYSNIEDETCDETLDNVC